MWPCPSLPDAAIPTTPIAGGGMAEADADGYRKRFDDSIALPDGKKLVTLRDANQAPWARQCHGRPGPLGRARKAGYARRHPFSIFGLAVFQIALRIGTK
jgi:hypothetical protein